MKEQLRGFCFSQKNYMYHCNYIYIDIFPQLRQAISACSCFIALLRVISEVELAALP